MNRPGWQRDLANQFQSGQRFLNTRQTRPSRIATQVKQQRGRGLRGWSRIGGADSSPAGRSRASSRFPCLRGETVHDGGMKALLVSADRGTDNTVDTIGRGCLDQKRTAPRFNDRYELILDCTDGWNLISATTLRAWRRQ